MSRIALACAALMATTIAGAQRWAAPLPTVERDGYYIIIAHPEAIARSDHPRACQFVTQVLDEHGNDAPYVFDCEPIVERERRLRSFQILHYPLESNGSTRIVFETGQHVPLKELVIEFRNAQVTKLVTLNGSDDQHNWAFITQADIWIGGGGDEHVRRSMAVPASRYAYYQLVLNDSAQGPVRIMDLGEWLTEERATRWLEVDGLRFSRREHGSRTILSVRRDGPFPAERFEIDVRSPALFQRDGRVIQRWPERPDPDQRGRQLPAWDDVRAVFTLSDEERGFEMKSYFADSLIIDIENGNDAPLSIAGVRAYVRERRLIAHLKAGKRYSAVVGDSILIPGFDIGVIRGRLPAPIDTLRMGSPTLSSAPQPATKPIFDPSKWWIWVIIITLMAGMGLMAVRMLRKEG